MESKIGVNFGIKSKSRRVRGFERTILDPLL